jgi:hypothetical protein
VKAMSPEDQDVRAEVVARDRPTNAPTQVTRDQVRRALRHITWTGAATLLGRLDSLLHTGDCRIVMSSSRCRASSGSLP